MHRSLMLLALILAPTLCTSIRAELPLAAIANAAPAEGTPPAKALDDLLNMFEGEMVGAAKTMPADKYNFAPSAAIFVPSQGTNYPKDIRTFAQQVAHVTQANYFFFSSVTGEAPTVDVKAISKLTGKDDLIAALQASFAYAHKAIATITPENAFIMIKGVDGMHTRATVASFAVAHGYDHYGQMVEYLRMNGFAPPTM
jgi:hypothetical protein